ncbi:helix-turn-helix domain-containing protein [Nocardioides sp. BP30]|uniref:PucR family transcriptional regulator n=1 Tax=Nocardioides sp. BP30 TaxID=3036374 RepID=UPI00246859DE|nr:helix-turn-helix domain-containing protein [Nocardioides sp. BP30]WGL53032.1 helix-turn-helix domain-containing protein [Nocardioides sp. BP30]
MSEARFDALVLTLPATVVRQLRDSIPDFAEGVTRRIQQEVPAYAGPADGRRRQLIAMAVVESANLFLSSLGSRVVSTAGVDDLFRRMGYGEAGEGNNLDALESALRIAGREAWRVLQEVVIRSGLPAATLGRLGDDLLAFVDRLIGQARAGQAMAWRVRDRDVATNRLLLLRALCQGYDDAVQIRADLAGWSLPDTVAVVAASAPEGTPWPEEEGLVGDALADTSAVPAIFVAPADHIEELVRRLRSVDAEVALARSWPVPTEEAGHAHRWVVRALELAASGGIPRQPVIDCARYRTQLWLHAEPALRRQMAQELLKPLFAETPNSREILSATLLVWLETRESAPAIAAILGVHPQTVRYRWRRINELFGESLHDPEFVVQLTMVLKASVPLWVAGDQSDFERYWSEESS